MIFAPEAECNTVQSRECLDCYLNISDNEYIKNLPHNELTLDLGKDYFKKKKKNKKSLDCKNEYFEEKNKGKTFSFKDIKF
jgi:hypothetical protein